MEEVRRQVHLPPREAVKIALRSLRIRFWRSVITTSGIFLGIAFLMSVLTAGSITLAMEQEMSLEVRSRQIWLVTISLLACVLGVVNSMLMAVTERYKEIGTMKCLGALNRFIVEMFLLEAGFQGLAGSFAGAVLGWGLMTLVYLVRIKGVLWKIYPWFDILKYGGFALVVGVVLSIVGAVYPAYRAAKMAPAEAMRVEI